MISTIPFVILAIKDDADRQFMTEFFLKYERLMYSEVHKIVKNQCDPEDIIQTALVKLIEKIELLRSMDERRRVNYMISTMKNTAKSEVSRLSQRKINSTDDEDWLEGAQLRSDVLVEDTVFRRENVSRMEAIWPQLDNRSRYLLQARYFQGLNQEEIAAELSIKPDSVRMEMSRARKKARELLEENFDMVSLWT